MNESPGARTMDPDGGAGPQGYIGQEVTTGVSYNGATGYNFPIVAPDDPPLRPEHLVTIPDDPRLDPDTSAYSIEIRYRTVGLHGNLIQKGQSKTRGGQVKIDLPEGEPQCTFRGAAGKVRVRWSHSLSDAQWHTLRCARTSSAVQLWVDGVLRASRKGATGAVNNTFPVTIAGKPNCDQKRVGCDYFGGQVDWVRITKG